METAKAGIGCAVLVAVFGLIGFVFAFVSVPAGSVGVVSQFGNVQDETLSPGLHFLIPFQNTVHVIDTRVQQHEFGTQDNQPIEAASKEYQAVYLSGKFNYHVDGTFASVLFKTVGEDFANRIIDPAFKDIIKEIVPTYSISDILPHRDEIRSKTKDRLNENLSRYHIVIDDIYLANVSFSPEYEKAIEGKQVAQQQVQTEQQILAQKGIQAQQAVIDAQGRADALVVAANGQAKANDVLTKSLTPELIQWTSINKLSDKIQVMLVPQNGNFLFNLQSGQLAQ